MWLSRQMKPAMPTADADLGVTTIAGEQAGVVTRGEVRALPGLWSRGICLAAGKRHGRIGDQGWPRRRGAVRHSRPAVRSGGHAAGEVYLYGPGGNAIYLRRNGTIELRGSIAIEGSLSVNGEPYKPCTCGTEGT